MLSLFSLESFSYLNAMCFYRATLRCRVLFRATRNVAWRGEAIHVLIWRKKTVLRSPSVGRSTAVACLLFCRPRFRQRRLTFFWGAPRFLFRLLGPVEMVGQFNFGGKGRRVFPSAGVLGSDVCVTLYTNSKSASINCGLICAFAFVATSLGMNVNVKEEREFWRAARHACLRNGCVQSVSLTASVCSRSPRPMRQQHSRLVSVIETISSVEKWPVIRPRIGKTASSGSDSSFTKHSPARLVTSIGSGS